LRFASGCQRRPAAELAGHAAWRGAGPGASSKSLREPATVRSAQTADDFSASRAFDEEKASLAVRLRVILGSAIIKSQDTAHQVLERLRGQGVCLSIDDYGTGHSTISYLKSLPVNELKIDKSFVTSLATSESDRIMVQSTIELAHQLGLKVVAEGAEDMETVRLLTQLGCDYAQGYAVGKALSLEDLRSLTVQPLSSAA
jgi:EAL domain-containing protein (putative c-di-GMP-specific phosphodiesterase class I)